MASMSLKIGATGQAVTALQSVLNHVVPVSPSLKVDGIFGQKTQQRVLAFQRKVGLAADGVVGPLTGQKLVVGVLDPSSKIRRIE